MKHIYKYSLVSLLLVSLNVNSQTVELRETSGGAAVTPGASFTIVGSQWIEAEKYIYAVNTGQQQEDVNMTRYEMSVQSGTENYYCWGICPAPATAGQYPEWVSPVSLVMDPGVEYNNFHGNHKPQGIAGQNTYLFTWFLVNDPVDTNSVTFIFDMAVGVEEAARNLKVVAYPNPATNYLQFEFDESSVSGNKVEIQLVNIVGEAVISEQVTNSSKRLDVSELSRGVYFYSITVNGERAFARKVILN